MLRNNAMTVRDTVFCDTDPREAWADKAFWRGDKLEICRELLQRLDPDRPPLEATPREYDWQLRALRERLHVYEQRLRSAPEDKQASSLGLHKAEMAIDLSLRFFEDVLTPAEPED